MNALNTREQAFSCVAALRGDSCAFDIIRDNAARGADQLAEFTAEVTAIFATELGKPGASLDWCVKNKAKGAPKFVPYLAFFRKLAKHADTAEGAARIASATIAQAMGKDKVKPAASVAPDATDEAPASVVVTRTRTPDDCINELEQHHAAGTLKSRHYAALQVMLGTSAARPVELPALVQ